MSLLHRQSELLGPGGDRRYLGEAVRLIDANPIIDHFYPSAKLLISAYSCLFICFPVDLDLIVNS